MENRKSSVRLQIAERAGGWSLGFLETKMRKKTPPPSSSRRRSAAEGHVKKEADEGMGDGRGGRRGGIDEVSVLLRQRR